MTTLLYLPGLGSERLLKIQRRYLKWKCRKRGFELVFFESRWHDDEPYTEKWQRLLEDTTSTSAESTIVLAVSAGGALLTRFVSENPTVKSAHCMSAKLKNAEAIGSSYRKRAPALFDAVRESQAVLGDMNLAEKTIVYRPLFDTVVPLKDMIIPGARRKRFFGFEHITALIWALVFHFPKK